MNKTKKCICLISLILLCFYQKYTPLRIKQENLMIVAHPDDETIFGGNELLHNQYTVICITNGNNQIRKKEFEDVMKKTNNHGIILSFPDKANNKRDDWEKEKEAIREKLLPYISSKKYHKIVTHNPDGEYGHIHHKMTNKIVTLLCKEYKLDNRLFYFNHYFTKKQIPKHLLLDKKSINKKINLLTLWVCQ